jgi:hypothetical protein
VAQSGSALEWGSRGRWFESSRPDHRFTHEIGPRRSSEGLLIRPTNPITNPIRRRQWAKGRCPCARSRHRRRLANLAALFPRLSSHPVVLRIACTSTPSRPRNLKRALGSATSSRSPALFAAPRVRWAYTSRGSAASSRGPTTRDWTSSSKTACDGSTTRRCSGAKHERHRDELNARRRAEYARLRAASVRLGERDCRAASRGAA